MKRSNSRGQVIPDDQPPQLRKSPSVNDDDKDKPARMRKGTSFGFGSRESLQAHGGQGGEGEEQHAPPQYTRSSSRTRVGAEPAAPSDHPHNVPRTVSKFNAEFGPAPVPDGPEIVQKVTNMRRTRSDPVSSIQSRILPILDKEDPADPKDAQHPPQPVRRTVSLAMGFKKIPEDWNAMPTIEEGPSQEHLRTLRNMLDYANNVIPPADDDVEPEPPGKRTSKAFDATVKVLIIILF
jgi:hypothetical protein